MDAHQILSSFISKIKKSRESSLAFIILLLSFIYLFTISLISKGLYGDTDSIGHYNIARFAFKHPWLFVEHWGKPLFTVLSAPFAQFGLQGSIFFNIICGLLSAWLIYRIAKKLNFKYALLAIPFALFAPIYMINLFTSLTEILFSLVLVAGIYFFLKEKYFLSSIIISFIPYARTEGIMFLVIFLVAFVLVKKFRAIPFLLTGFIIFSLAGYFHYHDFMWFFSAMPYSGIGSAKYGSGSFWYYIGRFHNLLGFPLTILALLGLTRLGILFFRGKTPSYTAAWLSEYFLVPVSIFGFILVHSFLWWRGMLGVLSSIRFMACIMPLCGLLALGGFNFFFPLLGEKKLLKKILVTTIVVSILYFPYTQYKIPASLVSNSESMKLAADALRKMGCADKRIVTFDPKLAFFLGKDPFDPASIWLNLPDKDKKDYGIPDSSLLVWDAHFGEFESNVYLDDLLKNQNFKLIDGFIPSNEVKSMGGQIYSVLIFQKVPEGSAGEQWVALDSMGYQTSKSKGKSDQPADSVNYSGPGPCRIGDGKEFSFTLTRSLNDFKGSHKVIFRGRLMAFIPGDASTNRLNLVVEVQKASGEMYRYICISATYFKPEKGKWFEMSLVTPLLTDYPKNGSLKIYAWYPGKGIVLVDNMILDYIPVE